MVTGGLLLEDLSAEERTKAGIGEDAMALVVKHVGEYGAHAVAKKAGFQKGDVVVAVDGRKDALTESGLLAWLAEKTKPGDRVPVTVLRGGKRIDLTLPMQ